MSYDPRLAAWPYGAPDEDGGGARTGSVRAARERLQAAQVQEQLPDRSKIIGLPQRPNQLVSQFSQQKRYRQQQDLTPPDSRSAASALSPTPQWPLPNDADDVLDSRRGLHPSPNRGPPPQRPPRPTSDELPIQQPTSPDYRESYQSGDVFSPTSAQSSRPLTTSSAASEASSLGSIPDFPVPQPPMPTIQPLPRRNPSLGPPPSSRRGPSSYYTQMSYVSPIAEESETRSDTIRSHHGSYASSNVIPSNDDFYLEDAGFRSEDDETITSDYGRESRASDHDDQSGLVTPALVRHASLGRRTKPSLMTIKSVDNFGERKGSSVKRKPMPDGPEAGVGAAGIGGAVLAVRDGLAGPESGSSLSENSLNSVKNVSSRFGDGETQRGLDPEKDGLSSPVHPLQQGTRQMTLADRVGKRRPPRIDVDAVREAEARGSLTSLPELIRRATRLAANLDRGKTASRLGLDFWEAGAHEKNNSRRSGSLSDMLAAFPPPGEATPLRVNTPNPKRMSKWPSTGEGGYPGTDSAMSNRKSTRRRKCCGMPMWTFVTLLIVLLFIIAAAVIIPIFLIVIPKMKNTQNADQDTNATGSATNTNPAAPTATAGDSSNGQCSGIITCQNGGVAILNSDRSCNCVCINGFTGKTCATAGDAGCTTTNIAGAANNATVGSGIPRLIVSAQSQFSIPLNSTRLLSIFSNLSLSCTAENALITFNGLASRSVVDNYIPILVETSVTPPRSLPLLDEPHPEKRLRRFEQRQAIGEVGDANSNAAAAASGTAAAAAASATPTPSEPVSSNTTALDFARLGVLLALQESGELDTAANAQESIQKFLTQNRNGNSNSNSVDVGPFSIDLVALSIKFQNGTTVQATSN